MSVVLRETVDVERGGVERRERDVGRVEPLANDGRVPELTPIKSGFRMQSSFLVHVLHETVAFALS